MARALTLARQGQGWVEPNPMVGCVLVADNQVIGEGYHQRFGGPHAEINALADAAQAGHADRLARATAYVTLEPCCHHGKTPPCTHALIEARIPRVVVATLDPFPRVAGQGVAELRAAGVDVTVGVLEEEARQLNAPYWMRVTTGRPWIIGKWAMSLDGKIATRTGDSRWISSAESRRQVHQLRSRVDAIVVGSRTAIIDDPLLTARDLPQPPARIARRVVIDSKAALPLTSRLVQTANAVPVLLWSSPEADPQHVAALREMGVEVVQQDASDRPAWLRAAMRYLVDHHQATNVLVEGGGGLLAALLQIDALDELLVFIAPLLIGGQEAPSPMGGLGIERLSQASQWCWESIERVGPDVLIRARRTRG
ncbi:MAG: riboflavin biosynthesis protein RibD [Pirellulaceae bacterium]|nr:MAG: riboflavin biosynthesis protein RibD [Pirellulaceae bacterium]